MASSSVSEYRREFEGYEFKNQALPWVALGHKGSEKEIYFGALYENQFERLYLSWSHGLVWN